VATSKQVQIRADLSNPLNATTTDPNEDVTYTLNFDNNQVTRTDKNGGGIAVSRTDALWSGVTIAGASAINGSQITYFGSNGNQLVPGSSGLTATQLQQVVRIKLELALTAKVIQPGNSMQLTGKDSALVDLRNRYFVMASQCTSNPLTSPLTFYN
jgi:hypothetical protein